MRAIAVDSAGDSVAVGGLSSATVTGPDFFAVKMSGLDGSEIWQRALPGAQPAWIGSAVDVKIFPGDDIAIAGSTPINSSRGKLTVARLAATDGSVLWRYDLYGDLFFGQGSAASVAVDSNGDLVVGGWIVDQDFVSFQTYFTVLKLDGSTGLPKWLKKLPGPNSAALSVVVDSNDDVIAGGRVDSTAVNTYLVTKLSGTDGGEVWSDTGVGDVRVVATDSVGDVFAAGSFRNDPDPGFSIVKKLNGTDGVQQWMIDASGFGTLGGMALTSDDDLIYGAQFRDPDDPFHPPFRFAVGASTEAQALRSGWLCAVIPRVAFERFAWTRPTT